MGLEDTSHFLSSWYKYDIIFAFIGWLSQMAASEGHTLLNPVIPNSEVVVPRTKHHWCSPSFFPSPFYSHFNINILLYHFPFPLFTINFLIQIIPIYNHFAQPSSILYPSLLSHLYPLFLLYTVTKPAKMGFTTNQGPQLKPTRLL